VEYKLFGGKPMGFHFFSVLLHCINCLLVFRFLGFLVKNHWQALFATLFFGLHPLRSEPVAWAASQKDLLFAMFYLLGLIQYLYYQQNQKLKHLCFITVFFVLSLLSKSTAVTFPLVLLLLDYLKLNTFTPKQILTKLPFFSLSLGMAVLTYFTQKAGDGVGEPYLILVERIPAACYILVQYAWQQIFPFGLSAFYPYPDKVEGHLPIQYWLFILPVVGFMYYVFKNLFKQRLEVFCLLFFVITNLVTLQLIQVGKAITADRFSYLPSIGLALFLVLLVEKLSPKGIFTTNNKFGLALIWCLVLAISTINQNRIWANSLKLYNSVLKKYPNVPVILNNRGNQKLDNGDQEGAIQDYIAAIQADSGFSLAYENRGILFGNLNRFEEAFQDYSQSIRLKPTAKALQNRALLYIKKNDYNAAISDLNQAILMDPNYSLAYKNRGLAYVLSGQKDLGCADFQKAASLGKEDAPMLLERFCR
jgi:tetratricopeptide (TPR) repeat protein